MADYRMLYWKDRPCGLSFYLWRKPRGRFMLDRMDSIDFVAAILSLLLSGGLFGPQDILNAT
jgi:hypothetical protein